MTKRKPETVASVVTIVTEMSRDRFQALEALEKGSWTLQRNIYMYI